MDICACDGIVSSLQDLDVRFPDHTRARANVSQLDILTSFHQRRWFWALVLGYCVFLVTGALYYQSALGYFPCELCIYARIWLLAIGSAALAGIFLSPYRPSRMALSLIMLVLVAGLGSVSWDLLGIDYNFGPPSACSFVIYPDWLPLDRWWPAMFEVQGACMATPKVLWNVSMADVLAASSVILFAAFAYALIRDSISALGSR